MLTSNTDGELVYWHVTSGKAKNNNIKKYGVLLL
jgi:hypothetical protein